MKRHLYRIPRLGMYVLLGLIAAATSVGEPGGKPAKGGLKLDHFLCYIVSSQTPFPGAIAATLTDQFQTGDVSIGEPLQFCNPVQKTVGTPPGPVVVTPIVDLRDHLTLYNLLTSPPLANPVTLTATNQFGAQTFTVDKAPSLMVPTQKNELEFPTRLGHYWCYTLSGTTSIAQDVSLTDQFGTRVVTVEKPELFCNPVEKTIGTNRTRIQNSKAHLVCYNIQLPQSTDSTQIHIKNQLEEDDYTVTTRQLLCAPSTKTLP